MKRKQLTLKQAAEQIDDGFSSLDNLRTVGLEQLKLFQEVRSRASQGELERLTKKHGADHPRVQALAARLDHDRVMLEGLNTRIVESKVPTPAFDRRTWRLQGRVLDEQGAPLPSLTLSLRDEQGAWIEPLGYACTGDNGYYFLTYQPPARKDAKAIPESQKLILTVSDSDGSILHQEKEPLYVRISRIDTRNIILGARRKTCVPPEPESKGIPDDQAPTVSGPEAVAE